MEKRFDFDYEAFSRKGVEDVKQGKSLTGGGGAFKPLLKMVLEASLQGEMQSHIDQTAFFVKILSIRF